MKNLRRIFSAFFLVIALGSFAQDTKITWKKIIQNQDENWFATDEAKNIADNVLLYQRDLGGWPKNIEMQNPLSDTEKEKLATLKLDPKGCTIDNGATYQEMLFLSKVYKMQPKEEYKNAFLKGVMYLVTSQYANGGFPQFFPLKKGYATHITYNDDAMVNVLKLFKELKDKSNYYSIAPSDEILTLVENAFNKGIDCILKTQYKQKGKLTAWCAQHDEVTLLPADARAFELASLSGKESAKITLLLMSIENPSEDVKKAIESSVCWFEKTKITGIKLETVATGKGNETDRVVVKSPDAEPLWARFMELENNKPFFCDRDGVKKYSIAEIGAERRNGYGWYSNEPKEVLKKYKSWKEKHK